MILRFYFLLNSRGNESFSRKLRGELLTGRLEVFEG